MEPNHAVKIIRSVAFLLVWLLSSLSSAQAAPTAWGYNFQGQLGDGSTALRNTPTTIVGGVEYIQIAAGANHTLALKQDGTVWSWGYNNWGQLGDGTFTSQTSPQQVPGLINVSAIAAGVYHSLALKQNGSVWSWGNNSSGQLGDGTFASQTSPQQVPGLSNVSAIAAGIYHSLALKQNGSVWSWGYNYYGQLGNGNFIYRQNHPVAVSNLINVSAIAAGGFHSLALKQNGSVWSWGYNYHGQLGNGNFATQNHPVAVSNLINVSAIAAGGYHSLALKQGGSVWSWGYNYLGQLGLGTNCPTNYSSVCANSSTGRRHTPAQTINLSGVGAIAAGWFHSIAYSGNHPPVAHAGNAQTLESTGNDSADVTLNGSGSSDADGDSLTYNWSWSGGTATGAIPTASFPRGTTLVTLVVDDGNGATDSASVNITVEDTTPPTVSAGADVTLEATDVGGAAFDVLAQSSANDVGCGSASLSASPTPPLYPLNTTTVDVTATDCANLTATDSMLLTVEDTTAPVLTVPADVNVEATGAQTPVAIGTATATDIFGFSITNDAPATYGLATTVVTWKATDVNGNISTATQIVTVSDTTAPTITAPADVNVEATGSQTIVTLGTATATDLVEGNVTVTNDAPMDFPLGSTTVTYTASDLAGNTSTATQIVTVSDTTAPTVTANLTPVSRGDDGDDSDEGRFTVNFNVSDIVDANPSVIAELIVAGHATALTVTNGQLIEFEYEDEKTEIEVENGILEIEAPAMLLRVTTTDASGNVTVVEIQPQGLTRDNDDDYDRNDDHDD